jgi:hypothetical protein
MEFLAETYYFFLTDALQGAFLLLVFRLFLISGGNIFMSNYVNK